MTQNRQAKVPRWYKFTPFLGIAPDLTASQWKILGLVAAVSLFEQYDVYLFTLNLNQIQADLRIADADLGLLGAIVRAGSLAAVFLTLAADHYGRRTILMVTVCGYTLFTGATAFAPNAEMFVVFQFLSRGFATAEVLIAAVVIVEEFAPEHRGWGIGALAAIQACGAGLASLIFSFVDLLPYGWRSMYLLGLFPLVLIAYWRRTLPETKRFSEVAAKQTKKSMAQPLVEFFRQHPKRVMAVCVVVFLFSMAASGAGFFAPKYLQDVHGWSNGSVGMLMVFGGAFAIVGNPLSGWLSDRYGRRPIASVFTVAFTIVVILFYASSGIFIPFLWVAVIFFVMGGDVTLTSMGAELFPTEQRSTASGVRGFMGTIAGVLGLLAVAALYPLVGSNWVAISIISILALGVPVAVWCLLPETAGKSLEEINATSMPSRAGDSQQNSGTISISNTESQR